MEIAEIKRRLSMGGVLAHYGLAAGRGGMMACPFHKDDTPSMQVFEKTGTFCCHSSNCHAGTGDAIEFVKLMEKCSKHEAIMKCKSLLGAASASLGINANSVGRA